MAVRRTLTLRRELLTELTPDELGAVPGAGTGKVCVTGPCDVSVIVGSLCGCLTNYCSIDVC